MHPVPRTANRREHVIGEVLRDRVQMLVSHKFALTTVNEKGVARKLLALLLLLSNTTTTTTNVKARQAVELRANAVQRNLPLASRQIQVCQAKRAQSGVGYAGAQLQIHIAFGDAAAAAAVFRSTAARLLKRDSNQSIQNVLDSLPMGFIGRVSYRRNVNDNETLDTMWLQECHGSI